MRSIVLLILLGRMLSVVQQSGVYARDNTLTQWAETSPWGSTALLAHDLYAGQRYSGKYFKDLKIGDKLRIIYTSGESSFYVVTEILIFPREYNNDLMFMRVYAGHQLVLQTCTESLGRWFVIAKPVFSSVLDWR